MRILQLLVVLVADLVLLPGMGMGGDDLSTPDINEGKIGTGFDDLGTPDINEGMIFVQPVH